VQIYRAMKISFFNKPTYKKFDLSPRYYDAEKTELERRMRKWEKKESDEKQEYSRDEFESELKFRWPSQRESRNSFNLKYTNRKRMLMLFSILAVIILILYFIGKKYTV